MNGYTGKLLRVNLSYREVSIEPLNMEWAKKHLGCQGLGARYLYEELSPRIDPLAPDNKILVVTGPLTGTIAPSAQKYVLVTKSPLTNIFIDSTAGGHFGPEVKYAGYDVIIIEGRSDSPVYLLIRDSKVEIKDASRLWGKDTITTEDSIKGWWGDTVKVLSIGPAGEKMVKFACVVTEYSRVNGRGGIGAVFGSKNLKAIAVKGSGGVGVADPEGFVRSSRKAMIEGIIENKSAPISIGWRGGMGTSETVDWVNEAGILPTRNFTGGTFESFEKINSKAMKKIRTRIRACAQCPMACSNYVEIKDGPYAGTALEGPEYETLALLGANCSIDNISAIAKMNLICNELGMDTMTAGTIASWAMECYEKGILNDKDTDGLALTFGNYEALIQLLTKIANREGIGDLLAEGLSKASQQIGKGSESFAMEVKGLGLPGYEPRGTCGMALAYATSPIGASHLRGFPLAPELFGLWMGTTPVELDRRKPENQACVLIQLQNWQSYRFSTGHCGFALFNPEDGLLEEIRDCTGWPEATDYRKIGERNINTIRLFNIREGISKKHDKLPARCFEEGLIGGPTKGWVISPKDFELMLNEYYKFRGWNKEGRPTLSKLKDLEIDDLISGDKNWI